MHFGTKLIQKGLVTQKVFDDLLVKANETGVALEKLLETRGVSEDDILRAKSEAAGVEIKKVIREQVSFDILKQVPEEAVRHYKFIPLGIVSGTLEVGMVNPDNMEAREALQFTFAKLNLPFNVYLISEKDFEMVLEGYQGLHGEVSKALGELESALAEPMGMSRVEDLVKDKTTFVEEAPVTKIVAVILKHAIMGRASDVHIEPFRGKLRVRFRVDGILYPSLMLPLEIHDSIVSRIKILAEMKLDEKRKPQDGRFGARIEGREIDFRISTFPLFQGEKVVIRILDKTKNVKTMEELGFSAEQMLIIREALKKPYGLILLTGPTGSGKTTTLYAMLQELDKERNNIVSLEDPVEYNIEGVSQSQIKPEIDYTFANGLKSILRQDPDMIMVGEIRDNETAALAIQAALTGHLVFSTLHANNAAGVVPRLIDMGVDPFLIAPTLLLSISQRLVKTLCPDSRREIKIEGALKERIDMILGGVAPERRAKIIMPQVVYQGYPSETCPQGGKGRIGVFEILQRTPELENLILTNPTEQSIVKERIRQGSLDVQEEAVLRILEGTVGIESLNGV